MKKGRRKLRSHKIMLNIYPWDLPSKFAFDPKCETMANYIFRLMYYIATLLGSALIPQGYAILHDRDVVTKHDLAKERSRLLRVFHALRDNTDDLFPAIYASGKLDLLNKNVRSKAAEMTLEEFIAAYMFYKPEMIGSPKISILRLSWSTLAAETSSISQQCGKPFTTFSVMTKESLKG